MAALLPKPENERGASHETCISFDKAIGEDIDFHRFGNWETLWNMIFTLPEEVPERAADADVLIVNKIPVNEQTIHTASHLKLVCVAATGTNNLDKAYLTAAALPGEMLPDTPPIPLPSIFAMLFYLLEHLRYYDEYAKPPLSE